MYYLKNNLDNTNNLMEVDIIGEGSELSFLQNLAKKLSISNVVNFHGKIHNERKIEIIF